MLKIVYTLSTRINIYKLPTYSKFLHGLFSWYLILGFNKLHTYMLFHF